MAKRLPQIQEFTTVLQDDMLLHLVAPEITDDDPSGTSFRLTLLKLLSYVFSIEKVVAHAGGGQEDATELTAHDNLITTAAAALASVKVKVAVAATRQTVRNEGANTVNIYPQSEENFVGLAANAPIPLAVGASITFVCFTDGEYQY